MRALSYSIFAVTMCGASASLLAATPPGSQCPKGYTPAEVDVTLEVSTSSNCPLLEDKELRKLVDKFGFGSVFAYPNVPGTCVSGENLTGTISLEGEMIEVEGYSESAQRFFTEAQAIGDSLFISGISGTTKTPFASGAAMTVVSLSGIEWDLNVDIVLADRFTIDFSSWPAIDTEDFLVIGSKGDLNVTGRLVGLAEISAPPPAPLVDVPFFVSGTICVK